MPRPRSPCSVPGCDRLEGSESGGLCAGHAYRKRHPHLDFNAPFNDALARRLSSTETIVQAAIALSDVDGGDDAAFKRAKKRLLMACARHEARKRLRRRARGVRKSH